MSGVSVRLTDAQIGGVLNVIPKVEQALDIIVDILADESLIKNPKNFLNEISKLSQELLVHLNLWMDKITVVPEVSQKKGAATSSSSSKDKKSEKKITFTDVIDKLNARIFALEQATRSGATKETDIAYPELQVLQQLLAILQTLNVVTAAKEVKNREELVETAVAAIAKLREEAQGQEEDSAFERYKQFLFGAAPTMPMWRNRYPSRASQIDGQDVHGSDNVSDDGDPWQRSNSISSAATGFFPVTDDKPKRKAWFPGLKRGWN